jgi:hypothetical protein
MLIQALTPTLPRRAVKGASQFVSRRAVFPSADSRLRYSLDSPLYRAAGEGGGEGLSDSTETAL